MDAWRSDDTDASFQGTLTPERAQALLGQPAIVVAQLCMPLERVNTLASVSDA